MLKETAEVYADLMPKLLQLQLAVLVRPLTIKQAICPVVALGLCLAMHCKQVNVMTP